jgi:hypothetical protein
MAACLRGRVPKTGHESGVPQDPPDGCALHPNASSMNNSQSPQSPLVRLK